MFSTDADGRKIATIRSSDRAAFRRCRRKWHFSSALRENREILQRENYFWFGTGGHFALEDYHGYNKYGHPCAAFEAYVEACKRTDKFAKRKKILPDDYIEQTETALACLEYYLIWLEGRDIYKTLWIDDEPQVEVRGQLILPVDAEVLERAGLDEVRYDFQLDRVVEDPDGLYWGMDYKFFKTLQQEWLDFDPQMSAYTWCGSVIYNQPLQGMILQQHIKSPPTLPRILRNGSISTDKSQRTTSKLYRQALIQNYGSFDKATEAQQQCFYTLEEQENFEGDRFIRREKTLRSEEQLEAIGQQILMETEEMLNPNLPLYPNPTKDCSWDCNLSDLCLAIDRNEDWEKDLMETTVKRDEERDTWRQNLP